MRLKKFTAALGGLICLWDIPAWGAQAHGGVEGLVSHEIGHILFIAGMSYMLLHLYRPKSNGPGWREFRGFLWGIILWNILTFSGHWLHGTIRSLQYTFISSQPTALRVNDLGDLLFYLSRLDHLILLPAFILLLRALQKWNRVP